MLIGAITSHLIVMEYSCVFLQEQIIFQWDEEETRFHDELAGRYLSQVKNLMTDYLQHLPEGPLPSLNLLIVYAHTQLLYTALGWDSYG